MVDLIVFAARAVLGSYLLFMATGHLLMKREMLTDYARYKGVPSPDLAVVFSGLVLSVTGLSVWGILIPGPIGAVAALLFFIPVTVMIHDFWSVEDGPTRMAEMTNFTKNVAILAALLIVLLA